MNTGSSEYINLSPEVQIRIPYSKLAAFQPLLQDPETAKILRALNPDGYPMILTLSELARELGVHKEIVRRKVEKLLYAGVLASHKYGKFRKLYLHPSFIPEEFRAVHLSMDKVTRGGHSYVERVVKREVLGIERKSYKTPYPTCFVRCSFCQQEQEARWFDGQKRCLACTKMFWIKRRNIVSGQHFRLLSRRVHLRCPQCQRVILSWAYCLRSKCYRCQRFIDVIPANCLEPLQASSSDL